ncbi:imidazole glycerol phosphate synthase subunit HisH [Vibrio cidicii]|uniref:Imidazole glycerol phosphate synthase subunit HisH n=2 Tax=Vibrio TaxID=662 RepID=A0A151KYN4_9VIBR|nr:MULTISPECIES: imidazole glycerol phosphate synthase subunit HisH [Vibrio]EGQ8088532.1 imidazole glycerol phosphate synthase subunit HisH [Vibrio vulnificus]EIE1227785.1 imidazole glycerol phosphate synthase subunit HisH [Vibrio vulnificus]EIZ1049343.1 imidazole glycerol phosphate synthase subunit HisH [Vibrio vulnificus]EJS4046295.1 imidazole glycerol phosphate synthase subunit HisH [Vibrio vulnificus]KFK56146.1 imidazole glycerol phosphate synthase [Vibrio vulnificus]
MTIAIVDYGMGNIGSVARAISACGYEPVIATKADDIMIADKILLPGVGSFAKAMQEIRNRGLEQAIVDSAIEDEIPILGICLGMQILSTLGYEHGESKGLNLIPGEIIRMKSLERNIRIPHVGWNSVEHDGSSVLFDGIPSGTDFYFVHSYHFSSVDSENVIATSSHGENFNCVVGKNNVFGTQFHPEKSQQAGLRLLKNFLEL